VTSLVTSYAWGSTSGPPVNTCWDLSTTEFPAQLVVATSLVINGKSLVKSWGDSKFFPNKRRKKNHHQWFRGPCTPANRPHHQGNPNSSSVKSIGVPNTLVGWHPILHPVFFLVIWSITSIWHLKSCVNYLSDHLSARMNSKWQHSINPKVCPFIPHNGWFLGISIIRIQSQ